MGAGHSHSSAHTGSTEPMRNDLPETERGHFSWLDNTSYVSFGGTQGAEQLCNRDDSEQLKGSKASVPSSDK